MRYRKIALFAAIALVYFFGALSAKKNYFPISTLRSLYAQTKSPPPSRYTFDKIGRLASDETKTATPCPPQTERTAVLLLLGQSNAGNHGGQRFASRHAAKVVNFYNGSCFVAASPLLGSDGTQGEYWTLLGNLLIETGTFDQVVLAPASISGSLVERWAPGGDLHPAMQETVTGLQKTGYRITHTIWHQGEVDYVVGTSEADYRRRFLSLVDSLRARKIAAPVYVSIASKCLEAVNGGTLTHTADNPVTRAQAKLPDAKAGIRPGVNTDAMLDDLDRHDDCHFGASGEQKAAEAWVKLLKADETLPKGRITGLNN